MTEIILPDLSSIYLGNIMDATIGNYSIVISLVEKYQFDEIPKYENCHYELFPTEKISIPIYENMHDFNDLLNYYLYDDYSVFIHCYSGQTLSPAFIIGYLMIEYNFQYYEAYNFLVERYKKNIYVDYYFGCSSIEREMESLGLRKIKKN